jgi:hypothetical protein
MTSGCGTATNSPWRLPEADRIMSINDPSRDQSNKADRSPVRPVPSRESVIARRALITLTAIALLAAPFLAP